MKIPLITSLSLSFVLSLTVLTSAHAKKKPAGGMNTTILPAEYSEQWTKMNTSEPKQRARERFNENKYGMFIHWGLYSQVGGVWKGRKMEEGGSGPAVAEWVMRRKQIPRAEYAKLAETFNPVEFDADEWVAIAKAAGMRYMVITSKHHDGFALFDSTASDFNMVKATPFKRDVIRELEQACKKAGLDFGVYYSHSIDWTDGGDAGVNDYGTSKKGKFWNSWDPAPVTYQDYIEKKALPQVRELIANYDLSEIWFDYPAFMPPHHSFEFYTTIYEANPEILVTQRIGNGMGDIGTSGDNRIAEKASEKVQEGIATTNHSWGYKSYDDDWKSPLETLYWLLQNSSMGANFLLNVGPTGNGKIPEESVKNLLGAGKWLKVNGEAVYGTRHWTTSNEGPSKINQSKKGGPKGAFDSQVTAKHFWFTCKDDVVYVSALKRPEGNRVVIQSLKDLPIKNITVLGESGTVEWSETDDGLSVTLPDFETTTPGYALKVQL
ncbi:alpha-L-fucosidase [Pontiellaceae bacterium B1224]|nr:alpha-L-fucosidase [Pontiellaceae bacterium B1224]